MCLTCCFFTMIHQHTGYTMCLYCVVYGDTECYVFYLHPELVLLYPRDK